MSEHKCRCAGCTKAKRAGVTEERERIMSVLRRSVTYYTKKARVEESAPRKFIAANTIKEVIAVIEEGEEQ